MDIPVNPDTNIPIHHHEFGVNALRSANSSRLDDLANIASEISDPFQRRGHAG